MIAALLSAAALAGDTSDPDLAGLVALGVDAGLQPNNPMANRVFFGAHGGFHLNQLVGVAIRFGVAPDLGEKDLKGLVPVLLDRAHNASSASSRDFQQPLDKILLEGALLVELTPLSGAVSLAGSDVGIDLHFVGGLAALSKNDYAATYDESGVATGDLVQLTSLGKEIKFGPTVGLGMRAFATDRFALGPELRGVIYSDNSPQYDPAVPVSDQRVVVPLFITFDATFFL